MTMAKPSFGKIQPSRLVCVCVCVRACVFVCVCAFVLGFVAAEYQGNPVNHIGTT